MKRLLMVTVLVVMLLTVTACEEELPLSGEIIDNMIEAMEDVETVRMEGDMAMQLYFMAEDMPNFFPLEMEIMGDASAICDLAGKEMEITGEVGFAGPDEEPIKLEVAMYLVDEELYLMYDMPIIFAYWMKSALPPGFGDIIAEGLGQVNLLNIGDVEVVRQERKEGTNCYLLEINTDLKGMLRSLLQAARYPYEGMLEGEMGELDKIDSSITVRIWMDKDDYYIVYVTCDIYIEVTPEMMGEYDEEGIISVSATMNTRYYDYDKKVEITLPPEAEDAEEMNSW